MNGRLVCGEGLVFLTHDTPQNGAKIFKSLKLRHPFYVVKWKNKKKKITNFPNLPFQVTFTKSQISISK